MARDEAGRREALARPTAQAARAMLDDPTLHRAASIVCWTSRTGRAKTNCHRLASVYRTFDDSQFGRGTWLVTPEVAFFADWFYMNPVADVERGQAPWRWNLDTLPPLPSGETGPDYYDWMATCWDYEAQLPTTPPERREELTRAAVAYRDRAERLRAQPVPDGGYYERNEGDTSILLRCRCGPFWTTPNTVRGQLDARRTDGNHEPYRYFANKWATRDSSGPVCPPKSQ